MANVLHTMPLKCEALMSSRRVRRMKLDEFGAFMKLLVEAWLDGARLPSNNDELRYDILNIEDDKQWQRIERFVIKKMFEPSEDGNYLVNVHQLEIWEDVLDKQEINSKRGKAGAAARWEKKKKDAQALLKHPVSNGNQSQSQNQSESQSQLIKAFGKYDWMADFQNVFKNIPLDAIECYWKNKLSKSIKKISPEMQGGHITKQIQAHAIEYHKEFVSKKEAKEKEKKAAKKKQEVLISGARKWSLMKQSERIDRHEKAVAKHELFSSLHENGDIQNKILESLIFEELGSKK